MFYGLVTEYTHVAGRPRIWLFMKAYMVFFEWIWLWHWWPNFIFDHCAYFNRNIKLPTVHLVTADFSLVKALMSNLFSFTSQCERTSHNEDDEGNSFTSLSPDSSCRPKVEIDCTVQRKIRVHFTRPDYFGTWSTLATKCFIHQDTLIKDLTTATTSKNPFVSLHWLSVTKKVLSFYTGASLVNSPYSCMLYLQLTVTWFVFYKKYKSNRCKNGKSSTLFPALSYLSFMYN